MTDILEILKYILPSLVVLACAFFLVSRFLENDMKRRELESETAQKQKLIELKISLSKTITPIRLQAYERIILFLERISPHSLLIRINKPGLSVKQLQMKLIQAIREEYEHNLSQQLYVSAEGWKLTRNAKEQMIQLINGAALKLAENATSMEFNNKIIELSVEIGKLPNEKALDFLKKEVRELF